MSNTTTPRAPAKSEPLQAAAEPASSVPAMAPVDKMRAIRERSAANRKAAAGKAAPGAGKDGHPVVATPIPGFAAAQARKLEFTKIADFAQKHGVAFDMEAALTSTMTAEYARKLVVDAMAAKDEAAPTIVTPTNASAAAASAKSNWDAANAKVAKLLGLTAPAR